MQLLTGEKSAVGLVPPQLWFVGSAVFHYLGPSFAVLLFARVPVAGVAWLRIVSAALVFALWRRPWSTLRSAAPGARRLIIGLGAVFAVMNTCFYVAIDRLPLGTVAAIEFVGPIVLALLGSRHLRNLVALVLAVGGVWLLTGVRLEGDPAAFGWAFANGALFALYIVLAHALARSHDPPAPDGAGRSGRRGASDPIDRLAASMLVAGVVITPLGLVDAAPALADPVALGAGVGVGVSSSVIPYVFDQLAMRRLDRATYALFVALLPATAVVIGVMVLDQVLRPVELVAVGLVMAGVVLHQEAAGEPDGPPAP